MQLSHYSKTTCGEWRLTLPIVCDDGSIRIVRIEEYIEGLVAFLKKDDGEYTNHTAYKTSKTAIKQAAKW